MGGRERGTYAAGSAWRGSRVLHDQGMLLIPAPFTVLSSAAGSRQRAGGLSGCLGLVARRAGR